jgi:hypothetical protein
MFVASARLAGRRLGGATGRAECAAAVSQRNSLTRLLA